MRINPTLDEVVNGKRGILTGIKACLDNECLVSAVALIFSGIDSLAALCRPTNQASTKKADFLNWCDKYITPQNMLQVGAIDLYAARCGVVHTNSPDSDLHRKGKARRIIYEWSAGPQADASVPLGNGDIVISIEALSKAFRKAVREFIIDSETDAQVKARVEHHLPSLLCYAPWPRLQVNIAA